MTASPDFVNALAWSLLHFLWQGTLLAGFAAVMLQIFRSPAARYLVGLGALAFMLVSFAVTFASLATSPDVIPALAAVTSAPATFGAQDAATLPAALSASLDLQRDFSWVAYAWLVCVFVLALRVAFGLVVLERLKRRSLVALPPSLVARFESLRQKLGIQRAIRYCECHLVSAPAVIGFIKPIVLLPMRALTGLTPEQLDAVIAHELGHVKRFDVVVNFFQVIAETLFFFHPAVWWLNKRIRADREDCCDDIALKTVGNHLGYAKALAEMATWRAVPSFAMAATAGPVASRVARLLGVQQTQGGARTAGAFTASFVLVTALVAGSVALSIVEPAEAMDSNNRANVAAAQAALAAQAAQPANQVQAAQPANPLQMPAPVAAPPRAAVPAPPPPPPFAELAPLAPLAPLRADLADVRSEEREVEIEHSSFIDEMASVDFRDMEVDDLVALKIHGVSAQYIRDLRAIGLNPDPDDAAAMKIHGITPEYVKHMRASNMGGDIDQLIAMKIHGVTPEYVKNMKAAGLHGDMEDMVAMKIHGVTPEYRKTLEKAGIQADVEELIEAKVMDITPEFIEKVRKHGFKDLRLEQLIHLKHANVL